MENMVDARLAAALAPLTSDVAELRMRIIGIDGNGTGREGALQRQDKKLQQLDDGQLHIIKQLGVLTARSETWSKAKFYKSLPIWLALILSLIGSVIGYLVYRQHTGHEVSQQGHAQVQPSNATNEFR
jgi:hypothetical protein